MTMRLTPPRVRLALVVMLGCMPALALAPDSPKAGPADKLPPPTKQAWTLDEALGQLKLYPHDPYLQYVALQLGRREDRLERTVTEVQRIAPVPERAQVDLFGIFTGSLAVQESLQLDRMRVPTRDGRDPEPPPRREILDIARLHGPTIKSHPWEKMLGDKKPDISPLARMVPEDFYFVEFRSLNKLLDVLDAGDLWSLHLFNQARRDARTQQVGERLRKQLAVKTNRLLRPFYDTVVEEVAVTGSDLFVAEGSDVTLLFRAKQPDVLKKRMDGFLDDAIKARPDAKRSEGEYLGVRYVHVTTPERDIHVFSAYPEPGLHVRSNSKAGLRRVLEAIRGKTPDGKVVRRLGDSTEFAYIRTLMPRGAKEEDGFIYLSDPFIRHLVGPTLKLTERRRMLCYNHLRMIGHAALMYRTEFGRSPKSLAELERADCCPGAFNKDDLVCMDGGTYTLSADGLHGVCSHHGHAHMLVPCCETPLAWVFPDEAREYKRFRDEYNNYWRSYFDPIALRIQVTPQRYRLETIVLPLINNSIYTGLARTLGGTPQPLDDLPVPKRNIFSVAVRLNKEELLKNVNVDEQVRSWLDVPGRQAAELHVSDLLTKGLGDQVGVHICDAVPLFDLDLPQLFSWLFGDFRNGAPNLDSREAPLLFALMSFNSPLYLSFPVRDEKVVDRFLKGLDKALSTRVREGGTGLSRYLSTTEEFYKSTLQEGVTLRSHAFRLGPLKWRFHWARIGKALYVASKSDILKDLAEAEAARANGKEVGKPEPDTTAHALVRLRARNWNQVLADYRLGWAENNRQACLRNLGPLASAGRAVIAQGVGKPGRDGKAFGEEARRLADQMYAVHFFCPEGGHYVLSPEGRSCSCSIHGSANDQKQPLAANDRDGPGKLLHNFGGLTASLTFLEDGLHAVVILERQK
jgi:hypothetical protein